MHAKGSRDAFDPPVPLQATLDALESSIRWDCANQSRRNQRRLMTPRRFADFQDSVTTRPVKWMRADGLGIGDTEDNGELERG